MKTVTRTYWIAVIVTALTIVAFALWACQTWQGIGELGRKRQRHQVIGLFNTMEATIRPLWHNSRPQHGQIKNVLESIVNTSPLDYVILEQGGERILQTRDAPATLTLPFTDGQRFAEGSFLFWRKVRLQGNLGGDNVLEQHTLVGETSDPMLGAGRLVMIVSGEIPKERRSYVAALRGMFVTLFVALLFVTASLIAWIMAIRSRLLANRLKTESTRRIHLEELGLAAAGLAHETKNPLGIILGIAQQIAHDPEEPEHSRVMLEKIVDEVDKASARLGHFMTFAQQRKVNATPLDAQRIGTKVVEVLQSEFDAVKVRLEMNCPSLRILADEDMLQQIIVNLLLNGLHASSEGSRMTIRMEQRGERAALLVEDQGSGISPELLPNIFKPYVAGNAEGHGLGLAIVKRLVEEHGWTIGVDSQLGRGTVVTIFGIKLKQDEERLA